MKKKTIAAGATLLSCVLAVAAFAGCGAPSCEWELTPIENGVDFHTEMQRNYLAGSYLDIASYGNGQEERSRPEAVKFEWSATPKKAGETIVNYTLQISDSGKFTDALEYTSSEPFAEVYNLKVDSDYYWRVVAEFSNGKKSTSEVSQFYTADTAPRNLYVDGITNVRDLGGWLTALGERTAQGLIYRCGRLNKSEQETVEIEITEAGKKTMLRELGVRSEIDLRDPVKHNHETGGITSSPLGEDVNYYLCSMEWDVPNLLTAEANRESVKNFFRILADESNYPLIYHCNIGTDRTGLFAFLVNGLLGVSEEDLYRDYLLSNMGKINNTRTLDGIKNSYVKTVKDSDGVTLSEKIYNCLVNLGVPSEDLDSMLNILAPVAVADRG